MEREASLFSGVEKLDARQVYAMWGDLYCLRPGSRQRAWTPATTLRELYQRDVAPHFGSNGRLVTLLIPAYNECQRVARSIELVKLFLDEFPLNIEVLYIVERSTDGTLAIARDAASGSRAIKVHDNQVWRGKGFAVGSGMRRAHGEVIFSNDTDLSVPLHQILPALAHLAHDKQSSVILGERIRVSQRNCYRRVLTQAFRFVASAAIGTPANWDTQCGFKGFRADAAKRLFSEQTVDGFAFDLEVLLRARRMGLHVASQPVPWLNDERSTVNPIFEGLNTVAELARLRREALASTKPAVAIDGANTLA